MFKEFLAGVLVLFIMYMILRFVYNKNNQALPKAFISLCIGLFCVISVVYNAINVFPNLYLETTTGIFRYGTFSGNLFAYSDEFRYRDEILFPILRGRNAAIDINGDFYRHFFELFSSGPLKDPLIIPEDTKQRIINDTKAFNYETEFNCIGLMDYATKYIPEELEDSFDKKIFPNLYINIDSLKDETTLVAMVDTDYNLYLMGMSYYESMKV